MPRQVVLAFGALAGVVLAHALDYLWVVPDSERRAALLAETGHVWHHLVALAASAGALAAVGALMRGFRRATTSSGMLDVPPPMVGDVAAVAVLQVALFAGMEVAERVLSHVPVHDLLWARLFLVGLALQVLVAWLVVAVLRTTEKMAERLLRGGLCPATPDAGSTVGAWRRRCTSRAPLPYQGCRGPPSLAGT